MNMINYTLPGYFTNKQADSICNKLNGNIDGIEINLKEEENENT